jgi:hypothetical protein
MDNFFKKTNIVDPGWIEKFDVASLEREAGITGKVFQKHFTNVEHIVPQQIRTKLKQAGIYIGAVRFFIWPKNTVGLWHVDGAGSKYKRNTAMNWVIRGSGELQWGENIAVVPMPERKVYLGAEPSVSDVISARTDAHQCLVATSLPHRIVTKEDGRMSISLTWTLPTDYPYEEIVKRLTDAGFFDV